MAYSTNPVQAAAQRKSIQGLPQSMMDVINGSLNGPINPGTITQSPAGNSTPLTPEYAQSLVPSVPADQQPLMDVINSAPASAYNPGTITSSPVAPGANRPLTPELALELGNTGPINPGTITQSPAVPPQRLEDVIGTPVTEPPGQSRGRTYGKFRKISQRGGPEFRPSNTQELIRRAAGRRLGLD